VLAVEELNLLDADDFARARRAYPGEPGEQLRAMMVDLAAIFRRISWTLQSYLRTRRALLPQRHTRFLGSDRNRRAGWRERDFRIMLPRVSGEPWDELRFAYLRRLFRGQMRRRGALAQWDFNHGQDA